jgi:predicted nucleotidyltransferase
MTLKVFGSMGRGDGREDRDVDLLVTLAPGTSALALGVY